MQRHNLGRAFEKHDAMMVALAVVGLSVGMASALFWSGNPEAFAVTSRPLYEPDEGVSYFGFTFRSWDSTNPAYGDTRGFAGRLQDSITHELGGKPLSIFTIPATWQNADGSAFTFSAVASQFSRYTAFNSNSVPFISWQAQTGWGMTGSNYDGITSHTVNTGSLDTYIHQYARDVKAYGQPVFINPICKEVNGSWNRNCSPNAGTGLTKADYINAYRRVVDMFRQEAVTNVSWIWTINTFPAPPANWGIDPDIASYYPGDDYVDWVGVDHYDYGGTADTSTDPMDVARYLDPEYNFAVKHAKPLMITEFGVRHQGSSLTPAQQQTWLGLMFDYFENHPKVKAIVYFNYSMVGPDSEDAAHMADHIWLYNNQVNYHPYVNNNDHRLLAESGANFRGTFANRIGDSRYIPQLQFNTTPLPDTVTPDIAITTPADNATVSGTVALGAAGYDAYGITKIGFYDKGALLGTVNAAPYNFPWSTVPYANRSSHVLIAKAYDAAGNIGASPTVTVTVADITPPAVSITSPVNGAKVPRNMTVTIQANASDVSGIAKVEFSVGGIIKCTDIAAPYSCNWRVPGARSVTYALQAKAYDTANNRAASTMTAVMSSN